MGDSRIINVGGIKIGVNGLDQVLADMAAEFADRPDDEVAAEMFARLEPRNYFASGARDEYAAALVREFHRHLGRPLEPEADQGLEVKVLGPGCPNCQQLYQRVVKVLTELSMAADVEQVKDTGAIAASGVLVTPGLVINGQVVSTGKVPAEGQIRRWLQDNDKR